MSQKQKFLSCCGFQTRLGSARDRITQLIRENTDRLDQLNMLFSEKRTYHVQLDARQKNLVSKFSTQHTQTIFFILCPEKLLKQSHVCQQTNFVRCAVKLAQSLRESTPITVSHLVFLKFVTSQIESVMQCPVRVLNDMNHRLSQSVRAHRTRKPKFHAQNVRLFVSEI